jgi:membrane protease YdiL (CAAX protease family)
MPFPVHATVFLAEATPAVEPELSLWGLVLAVASAAAAIGVAWLLGLLRPSRTGMGHRVPPDRPIAPLLGVLFAGFVVWQALPIVFLSDRAGSPHGQAPTTTKTTATHAVRTIEDLSPRDLILISAAVPMLAFVVLLAGDQLIKPHVGQQLGFDRKRFPYGVAFGVCGLILAMPPVYAAMVASERVYRSIHYSHPSEHDLLRVMGETTDPVLKYIIIAAAVLIAPFWEELLFRGHIQTLIRELFIRIAGTVRRPVTVPSTPEALPLGAPVLSYTVLDATDAKPHPLASWSAIILTSAMFAGVHAPWQMPAIFVLALCLSFAYERTNNLWVSITMHATFNTLMTGYFFLSRGHLN